MKVICVSAYPRAAAATRFRMEQYITPLKERGIELDIRPFLSNKSFDAMYSGGNSIRKVSGVARSFIRRFGDVLDSREYDLLFVQREAMFFGPEVFESLFQNIGRLPIVLDLDDATYVKYESPTYGRLGSGLKFFGKTDRLIKRSAVVTCGNGFIAEYVRAKGKRAEVIPTVVNTKVFTPLKKENDPLVIGWIGTHSTFPFVEVVFPVLQQLAQKHRFVLRLIGTGRETVTILGVEVENRPWSLENEIEDFRSIDIGLYPIVTSSSANELWLKGKSGFKAIQYMAVGVPFVMSPIGVSAEIGVNGDTHLNAETPEDWYNALSRLLSDASLRWAMGENGRSHALENYTVEKWSAVLADVLHSVVKGSD